MLANNESCVEELPGIWRKYTKQKWEIFLQILKKPLDFAIQVGKYGNYNLSKWIDKIYKIIE